LYGIRSLSICLKEWIIYLFNFLKLYFKSSEAIRLENIALRSQLAVYTSHYEKHNLPKPKPNPAFRQLWVFLSKHFMDWKNHLVLVKPETVIKWHRTAFKFHWKAKSRKTGRPKISNETISLIKRVHRENPLLSAEKIHEKLCLLGLENPPAPNTISKYVPTNRKPPSKKQIQSWKTFLNNHQADTWATDFFTVPSLTFDVLYGLVIIHHQSRKIIHFAVTTI